MNQLPGEFVPGTKVSVCKGLCVEEKELGSRESLRASQGGLTQSTDVGSDASAQVPDLTEKWENHPVGQGVALKGVAGEIFTL